MTEKDILNLRETIAHNMEQEGHWRAERHFWTGTVIVSVITIVVTGIVAVVML